MLEYSKAKCKYGVTEIATIILSVNVYVELIFLGTQSRLIVKRTSQVAYVPKKTGDTASQSEACV